APKSACMGRPCCNACKWCAWRGRLTFSVASPTRDCPVIAKSAYVQASVSQLLERTVRWYGLTKIIATPTDDIVLFIYCARLIEAGGNAYVFSGRGRTLPLAVVSPARNSAVGANATGVRTTNGNVEKIAFGRFGLARCISSPAVYRRIKSYRAAVICTSCDMTKNSRWRRR